MRVIDKVLVSIPKRFEDEILLDSGLKLYFDTSFAPDWHVCTSGIAEVVPDEVTNISVGDEIAISYFVIADRTYPGYDQSFFPVMEETPYMAKWKNGLGQWLTKMALPTPTGRLVWTCTLQDNRMELIDGAQGNESDISRYLSQFSFQDTGKYTHTNQIEVCGKIFWKVETFNIFAKKIGGEIVSVSDRVILEPIEEDLTERFRLQGLLNNEMDKVKGMYTDRGKVISGGENVGLEKGDIVGFEQKYCEKYTLWGVECFLLKETRIDVICKRPALILHI